MSFANARILYKPGRSRVKFGDRRSVDKYGKQPKDNHDYVDGIWEDNPYAYYDFIPSHASGYRESMNQRVRTYDDRRYATTEYGVFERFIESNVGRLWTEVHGELMAAYDRRSFERQSINHLIKNSIVVDTVMDGDQVISATRRPYEQLEYYAFYVHPVTGLLLSTDTKFQSYRTVGRLRVLKHQQELSKKLVKIDNETEHHKIDGVWFEIKFAIYQPHITRSFVPWFTTRHGRQLCTERARYTYPSVYDVLKKQHVEEPRVAVTRRTLSHTELKQHKLI